jgi:structural maintenance of chromosome 3 (chondroitin sulfate proteoglycan 6)
LSDARQRLSLLQVDKSQADSDRRGTVKSKVEIECLINDLEDSTSRASSRKSQLKKMLEQVREAITNKETELAEVSPLWNDATRREQSEREQLEEKKARVDVLYGKQGRASHFKTKKERDDYLNSEIHNIQSLLQTREENIKSLQRDIEAGKASVDDVVTKTIQGRKTLEEKRGISVKLAQELQDLVRERDALQEQRK